MARRNMRYMHMVDSAVFLKLSLDSCRLCYSDSAYYNVIYGSFYGFTMDSKVVKIIYFLTCFATWELSLSRKLTGIILKNFSEYNYETYF